MPPENSKVEVALQDDAEEQGPAEVLPAEEAGAEEASLEESLEEVDQDLDSDYSSEQEAVPDAGVCRHAPLLPLTGGASATHATQAPPSVPRMAHQGLL